MSVIAIQAEAAPRKVAYTPPELAESFAEIRASALSGLDELRLLLGVMRSSGAEPHPSPVSMSSRVSSNRPAAAG